MKLTMTTIFFLFLVAPAWAQWDTHNYIGVRWDPNSSAYDAFCNYQQLNHTTTFSLFLVNPVNPDFGDGEERQVTNIAGFECDVTTTEGAIILGWSFPPTAINIGSGSSLIVGFSEPVPVIDNRATLATFDVFFGGPISFELPETIIPRCVNHDNCWLFVNPIFPASIPNTVSYLDADDPHNPRVEGICSGPNADMQFEIYLNPTVGSEMGTWESLKAMYR